MDYTALGYSYFAVIRAIIAGLFVYLVASTPAHPEDVFVPTGRYAQKQTQRQWYLVSEPWCSACPAAKARFLKLGWPKENILTIAQCEARFGFRPDHVPFEFGEPEATCKPALQVHSMSHSEMVALHNQLHGGGSWTWPGDLATHLRTAHGVSTSQPTQSQPARVQQSGNCPGGNCPTNRVQRRRGGILSGMFR